MNTKRKFILFVLFVLCSIIVAIFSGYFGLNPSSIQYFANSNHTLISFIYTALFIVLSSFSFSVSVMTSLGVLLFSAYEIIIYSIIGIMGSSIIDFFVSRRLGKDYVKKYIEKRGSKIEEFDRILERNAFKTTFLLSSIFFVPPTIPSFLGGIIKIKFKNYCIATFLGNLPNTILTVYLIRGILYSDTSQIFLSIFGLIAVTVIALYLYKGEVSDIFKISFPRFFR